MNRPLYESKQDRIKEAVVGEAVARRLNCTLHKLPMSYGVDFALFKGSAPYALAEIKCRDDRYSFADIERMNGLMLSLQKCVRARQFAEALFVPFCVVGSFSGNDVRMMQAHPADWPLYGVIWGGRKDRRDPQDLEPVVIIPPEHFQKV